MDRWVLLPKTMYANDFGVSIRYQLGALPELIYEPAHFDVIALIYAHFPASIRSIYYQLLDKLLRKEGVIIFEAFSKHHLSYRLENPAVEGPIDLENLFSVAELKTDFQTMIF